MADDAALKPVLSRLASGDSLSEAEAEQAFATIMRGEATPAQIGGLLMALRVRGETVAELTGAVRAMRGQMRRVVAPPGAVDVCGTGGDQHGTLNISTAVGFVLAGLGVPVAKHGNRALSSRTGAADVLQALGVVSLDVEPSTTALEDALRRHGLVFLFAPAHHPALRHAASVRRELGTRTLFNLLGPLANPAGVTRQLLGLYEARWLRPVAETLGALGSTRAWVVHGTVPDVAASQGLGPQGLDELTLAGPNDVAALENGAVRMFQVLPEDAGLARAPVAAIAGGDAAHNAAALEALLRSARGAYRDTVLLNAAAALIVADRVDDLRDGVAMAARALDEGAALAVLEALRAEVKAAGRDALAAVSEQG